MVNMKRFLFLIIVLVFLQNVDSFLIHIYCGTSDCYKLLGVSRKATTTELKQAYNNIQERYQLDKTKENDVADPIYEQSTTAYNILSNADTRKDYDYMLAHPNNVVYHYYQYFKHLISPNVNLRGFVVVSIILISVIQYLHKKHSYSTAVRDAMGSSKNRNKAIQKIQEVRFMSESTYKETKEQRKREEERVLRQIVEESISTKGKYCRPRFIDTLFIQILFSPYYFLLHMKGYMSRLCELDFFKEEYQDMATYKKLNKKLNKCTDSLDSDSQYEDSYNKTEEWINNNIQ